MSEAPWSACYAPHASMYLDQHGRVRACCQNTGVVLGDVTRQTLREIWESADAERLRAALEVGDHSAGCEFCEWQQREGNAATVFSRQFDELAPAQRRPRWPRQMELSLSNACNLACAMCNGDWSSTIRTTREGRAPLPAVYGDAFFEQLAEFLPHLERVEFLGGEPFLGKEPLRVMEMLAELPDPPRVTITTNGSIATPRVERILGALRPNVVVSLDGITAATYDAIRVGAHLPDVLANLDRFQAVLGPGRVSITHCLMTANWHELAELLRFAQDRDLRVGVNVVRLPAELSLYRLGEAELAEVVAALRATPVDLAGHHLAVWEGQLAALENRLAVLRRPDLDLGPGHGVAGASAVTAFVDAAGRPATVALSPYPWLPFPLTGAPAGTRPPPASSPATVVAVDVDTEGTVAVRHHAAATDADGLDGGRFESFTRWLMDRYGPEPTWSVVPRRADGDTDEFRIRFPAPAGQAGATLLATARRDDHGTLVGSHIVVSAPGG